MSVGIEADRLLAVLEGAIGSLELLATVPTSLMGYSKNEFSQARQDNDACAPLTAEIMETLEGHLRLEAAILHREKEMEERLERQRKQPKAHEEADGGEQQPEIDESSLSDAARDDDEDNNGHAQGFSQSLQAVVRLLRSDKRTRDALRLLSATDVSHDVASFVHGLTDLVVLTEQRLATTAEQDETRSQRLYDASQRLAELQDDAAQLRFELSKEREARQLHAMTHVSSIAALREQLSETQRVADEALRTTQRSRELDAQALRSQFEMDSVATSERLLALCRVEGRVTDAHEAEEVDDRKRVARMTVDVHELVHRYDVEMAALDAVLAQEARDCDEQAIEIARLSDHFDRIDEDRRYQLEERRQRELERERKQRQDLNLFKFIARLQAVVRGFLTRRRVRLEEKLQKKRRKAKKKKTKRKPSTSPRKPSRPASAAGIRRPTRR